MGTERTRRASTDTDTSSPKPRLVAARPLEETKLSRHYHHHNEEVLALPLSSACLGKEKNRAAMFSRKRKDTTDPSRPGEAPMAAVRRLRKTVSFNLEDEMPPSRGLTRRIDDLLPPGFPCDAGEGEETVELKRNASFKRAISIMQWMEETKNQDDQKQQQQHQKTPSTTQSEASTILALGSSLNSSVSDVQVPPTPAPAPATQASPNAKAPSSSCLQSNLNRGWELLFLQCRAALNENRTLKSQCEVMRQICLGQAVKLERIRD